VEYIFERSPERALLVFYRASRRGEAIAALQAEAKKFEAARQGAIPIGPPLAKPKGPDELLLSELVVSHAIRLKRFDEQFRQALPEAKVHLTKLANHDEWWVRRYVAEIMRRHPELRVSEVVETLSNDGNSSVSKAAKAPR
jgi:hypothetical protein